MFGPTTLTEAREHRYGRWAGFPAGHPYRDGYCIAEIVPSERGAFSRQCSHRIRPGKLFCKIHDPVRRAQAEDHLLAERTKQDKERKAILKRGAALIKRTGIKELEVHYNVGLRFKDSGYRPEIVVPFAVLERWLKEMGR